MSAALVRALVAAGIDVSTTAQEDARGRDDTLQLLLAASLHRTLYSFNVRDFARLHAQWMRDGRHHAGIIVVSDQQMVVGEQARRAIRLASSLSPEGMFDRIEYLGAWG